MQKNTKKLLLELLYYIKNFQNEHGYAPSVREMAAKFNKKSTCTIAFHLNKLCELGILQKSSQRSRAIKFLIEEDLWHDVLKLNKPSNVVKFSYKNTSSYYHDDTIDIPILGQVTAGQPMLAIEEYGEKWTLPYDMFNKSNLFILRVQGDSMINAGIYNGDKIVVAKQNTANNGDIVVALIEDSATVKTYYREKDRIRLQPQNDLMSPMYFDKVEIVGKVVGLIRNL